MSQKIPNATISCCVCGGTVAVLWRESTDNLLGGNTLYRAVRCTTCGTVRLDPRPPAEAMAEFYAPTTYARAEGSQDGEIATRLTAYSKRVAERATELISKKSEEPRFALDVGCGDGRFLTALQRYGWTTFGTETDAVAAALAAQRTGATIYPSALESLMEIPDQSFHLISLLHVLEHLPNPKTALAECHRLLKPDGVILLHLPNVASLEASLFGSSWYHLDLPRHFWGFTPRSLRRLLTEAGFDTVRFRFLPFLFVFQSVRNWMRRGSEQRAIAPRGQGGKLQTRLFLLLLGLSSFLGMFLTGEIMECRARRR